MDTYHLRDFLSLKLISSRFVQVVIKNSSASVLVRVTKWMEEHLDELLTTRPAVFLAMAIIDRIEDLIATDGSWSMMLEDVCSLMLTEKVGHLMFF